MTDWLYQTPDKKWGIKKQNNTLWDDIFNVPIWNVCLYSQSLADWNIKNPELRTPDYFIMQSEGSIECCFKYLVDHEIITKEEKDEQLKLITTIDKIQDV